MSSHYSTTEEAHVPTDSSLSSYSSNVHRANVPFPHICTILPSIACKIFVVQAVTSRVIVPVQRRFCFRDDASRHYLGRVCIVSLWILYFFYSISSKQSPALGSFCRSVGPTIQLPGPDHPELDANLIETSSLALA